MFFAGNIAVALVTSFMKCNALMCMIDLYDIGIIYGLDRLADVRTGNAIVMSVFS